MKRRGLTEQERPRAEMIDVTDASALSELKATSVLGEEAGVGHVGETVGLACGGEQDYRVTLNRSFSETASAPVRRSKRWAEPRRIPTVKKVCHG